MDHAVGLIPTYVKLSSVLIARFSEMGAFDRSQPDITAGLRVAIPQPFLNYNFVSELIK
jgi:hypothetical protein